MTAPFSGTFSRPRTHGRNTENANGPMTRFFRNQ